jgi:hypothetical protein
MSRESDKPANGDAKPVPSTPVPDPAFVEDIFLVRGTNVKPIVHRLREELWKKLNPRSEEDLGDPEIANLLSLIRNEVVVAHVPEITESQGAFTFVNLTALAVNKE